MAVRELVHEDESVRVYEVYDDEGNLIGRDVESKVDPEPTPAERLAAVEAAVEAAAELADDASATAQDVAKAMRDALSTLGEG